MNVSLYQAASALTASSRWQELISENLSSSAVPGFKKQDISFSAVHAGLSAPSLTGGAQRTALTRATSETNFTPGEMRMTGSPNDVAIEGRGFFAVQLANGATAYTRNGEFHVTQHGQLTTKEGYPILGDSGPVQLDLSDSSPISISATGEVSQGTELRGKLRIVDFQNPELLTSVGAGNFVIQNPSLIPQEVSLPSVRQGFLESANTNGVSEMANLITSMRAFEANQKVIQVQDDRMGRAISELGNPQ